MTSSGDRATPLYALYCAATSLLYPLAWRSVRGKLERAGVAKERQRERLGHATQARPKGRLIWFHAASVGESLSVLTLITRMGERLPDAEFLITSGTPTSAELVAKRLPPRTRHQFAPLDARPALERFFAHWRPDAGVFVESELWPRTLVMAHERGIRLALLNARLSQKSVQGWQRFPRSARFILSRFDVFVTQNDKTARNLIAMGADAGKVRPGTNLKAMSDPLPVDRTTLTKLQGQITGRPVWIASSTHAGEEETVLAAHAKLLERWPDLLLLLIPRHPERRDEVAALLDRAQLTYATRSKGQRVTEKTQVYMADTLGETGTWYALSPIVFLGGSLLEIGGHNPFEPAQAGAAVLTGPGFFNFAETFAPLIEAGGAIKIETAAELGDSVGNWLADASALSTARNAARNCVNTQKTALDGIIETLCAELALD